MTIPTTSALLNEIEQLRAEVAATRRLAKEKEHALSSYQASEARYRTVFENTATATFVKENDLTISMVNTGFEALTGYTKAQIENRMKWTDFLHPDDHEEMLENHRRRRAKDPEVPTELECRVVDRHGIVKDVVLKLDLIPGTQKSIGSFMNVSRLKRAEAEARESRAKLSAILESFDGLIYVSSQDYRLLFMNNNLIRGIHRDATGERCYRALQNRREPCPFCVLPKVLAEQTTLRFEVFNPQDKCWYQSVNSPLHHANETVSLLALVTDISDRKRSELALRQSQDHLRQENLRLKETIADRRHFGNIVGQSRPMQTVYAQIEEAAANDASVVIFGEPGTGKELVAHAIHEMSARKKERFVPVHCGAIPESLIESEFFGYRKGAFSGADSDRPGYIAYAHKGTLFLDEIGEVSLHMQVKLLRVLEGGGYTPIGGNQLANADLRIISATNRDLGERIAAGAMRADFYYRIHILPITLPPLRERMTDLPLLADHFLKLYDPKQKMPPLTAEDLQRLMNYEWPGNVRELQNVLVRYCSVGNIELPSSAAMRTALPQKAAVSTLADAAADEPLRISLARFERELLKTTMERHRWHRSRAAKALGVDRKTLFTKLKRHRLMDL
ncbi:MAG: sigma 54-interacting transcriptional regulator [Desulfosarcinaceae bacterium]|nr:sigma 54-interacting transcriptional regulator [Desulfosarcinaceae bacterium]